MAMDKVTFVDIEQTADLTIAYAIINRGNGEFTSMTKAHYDELKAAKNVAE
jgi:hypothetical protein